MSPTPDDAEPTRRPVNLPEGLNATSILRQVAKMRECPLFARSPRLATFLTFTVEQCLAGNTDRLKEYSIGVEVFARAEQFDPRLDSIVRVEARRLRKKVDCYYATIGASDEVLILYRRGEYTPQFLGRAQSNSYTLPAGKSRRLILALPDAAEAAQLSEEVSALGYGQATTVSSVEQLGALLPAAPSDLVLLVDSSFLGALPASALAMMRGRIIPLTSSLDPSTVATMCGMQAMGYLLRPVRPGELLANVRLAATRRTGNHIDTATAGR